jgi:hypothetical protein
MILSDRIERGDSKISLPALLCRTVSFIIIDLTASHFNIYKICNQKDDTFAINYLANVIEINIFNMNKLQIKSFEIYGLFGTDNIVIPFDDDGIKILIGENGTGKTQMLNLFYYFLTANFLRLSDFKFSQLKLSISNNEVIEFSKKDIEKFIERTYNNPLVKEFINEFGIFQFEILRNKYLDRKNWQIQIGKYEDYTREYSIRRLFRVFETLEMEKIDIIPFEDLKNQITETFKSVDILYFPTYRRVEEDLYNFGYDEDELNFGNENTLIQFGMKDVKKRFENIQNVIDKLLKEGLTQFTKDILNIVVTDDISDSSDRLLDKISENDIEIILSRVGGLLPDNKKTP